MKVSVSVDDDPKDSNTSRPCDGIYAFADFSKIETMQQCNANSLSPHGVVIRKHAHDRQRWQEIEVTIHWSRRSSTGQAEAVLFPYHPELPDLECAAPYPILLVA